jgi:transketolase
VGCDPIADRSEPAAADGRLRSTRRLAVVEEHVAQGGAGQQICRWAIGSGIALNRFRHLHAIGYPSATYGSQAFLRRCSGLDPRSISDAAAALAS